MPKYRIDKAPGLTNFKCMIEVTAEKKTIGDLLERPLILGASVSADRASISPGKRLALEYTDRRHIHTLARGGAPGRETVRSLHESDIKDRTILIGMDLFFWDSALPTPQVSLHALHRLIEMIEKFKIPLVLGDIPELLPGWQQSRKILQDEIHRMAHMHERVLLMPLEHLYKDVLKEGAITYKGRIYNLWDLVPDGLHIGDVAGRYLADVMGSLLKDYLSLGLDLKLDPKT